MKGKKLTAADYQAARNEIGMSLSRVGKDTGINRNYISKFEAQKFILDEQTKAKLRGYYESLRPGILGGSFAGESPEPVNGSEPEEMAVEIHPACDLVVVDEQFVVPAGIDPEEREALVSQIHENETVIDELLASPVPIGEWLLGSSLDSDELKGAGVEVLQLMAANWAMLRRLQGAEYVEPAVSDKSLLDSGAEFAGATIGDFVSELLQPESKSLKRLVA